MTQLRRRNSLAPLRERRFLLFWAGQSLSFTGNAVFPVALTLHLVGDKASATSLGLVLATMALSEGVFYLLGGVWADQLPRHLLMATADTVRCLVQVGIGIAMVRGMASSVALIVAAALLGAAGGAFSPASSGLVVALVDKDRLREANAIMTVSRRTALLLGPALATTLTLTVGAGWALILDGITFAVSACTLVLLRLPRRRRSAAGNFPTEVREGWREVRARPWLYWNFVVHGLWNLARTAYFTVGPVVVIGQLGGEAAWGAVVQGSTVGGLCGAVFAVRFRPRRPLVAGNLGLALGALPLLLMAIGAPVALIAPAAGLMTAGLALLGPLWDTTVQEQIPEHLLSRVAAFDWLVSTALVPLGMAVAGPLAVSVGNLPILFVATVAMALPALTVLARRDVRTLGARPDDRDKGAPPAPQPTDAPV